MANLKLSPPPLNTPVDTNGQSLSTFWWRWLQALYVIINNLLGYNGGSAIYLPFGQFHDTTTQTTTANTVTAITFNSTDNTQGVSIGSPTSRIVFATAGNYNFTFSAQLSNTSTNTIDNVTIWLRQNGVDLTYSAGIATVVTSHGGAPGTLITAWNQVVTVAAGDYLELMWTTDNGVSSLRTYAAGTSPTHPASPSVAVTATYVSNV